MLKVEIPADKGRIKQQIEAAISVQDRLNEKIDYLHEMLEKYNRLNERTHNNYKWRSNAIEIQLEVLEELVDGEQNDDWDICYAEDLRESEEKMMRD